MDRSKRDVSKTTIFFITGKYTATIYIFLILCYNDENLILEGRIVSKVKNEPKYKNKLLQAIRAQLEHRAFWLYLLCDEAQKRGLDPKDFGSAAIKRCGLSQGADLVEKGKTDSLKGLRKTLFTKAAQLVFEMDVLESTDDRLSIDFHYCPLVKAWQKAGCSDEEIAMLCDIAMCGDHGIGERYGSVLDLPKCIAKGDDVCSLRYHKKDV